MHKHKCSCGFIWEHEDICGGDFRAHTCPECGQEVWEQYEGRGKAKVLSCEAAGVMEFDLRELFSLRSAA